MAQKRLAYAPRIHGREQPKCPLLTSAIQAGCGMDSAYRLVGELSLIVVYIIQLHCNVDLRSQIRWGLGNVSEER
jgi:hypothetical protein